MYLTTEGCEMKDIDLFMQRFCDAGAKAVCRYIEISGEPLSTMPEYFMPAFIMNCLGDDVTFTLETGFATLHTWNGDSRERNLRNDLRVEEPLLSDEIYGRRIDMVIFEGQNEGKPKHEQDIFALAEFKRGWIDSAKTPGKISDRDKLLMFMNFIDTSKYGIVCGYVNENHLNWQAKDVKRESKDRLFMAPIKQDNKSYEPMYFCARLIFAETLDNQRLNDLRVHFLNQAG